jgi:hypothetical protein
MYVRFAHLHLPVDLLNFRIVLLNTRTESLNLLFKLSIVASKSCCCRAIAARGRAVPRIFTIIHVAISLRV